VITSREFEFEGLSRDARAPQGTTSTMSKTVLHADDSASVRRWVAEQLGDMDLKVISVADGEAALNVLREAPCDLLLTDLEMPNLDGLSLVSAVRELPTHRFLPVLVLSCRQPNEFQPQDRQGVTGWLVKPIEPEQLRRWVKRALPR
jgi:two-component system, chemotaxis family, chemotaxis protein CheY